MPKLTCLCGENINLSPIPNPQGFKLVWEPLREKLIEEIINAYSKAQSESEFEDFLYKLLYPSQREFPQVYECPNCYRLAVFASAADTKPRFWYQQELAREKTDSICSILEISPDEDKTQPAQSLVTSEPQNTPLLR
ncbi:MAG TPA: hypothetical protein DEG17_26620 [Cyanobacteria bacterium UBA11149]|nr:hypothetical protein [Cyanobacteria bacterium UBA11366]HBK62460.1 hypothetical protein [Cyanobacteria bacterium UBA11166]HBR72600.1 hypothetical protein [Cyanobacteria bacterium UBA11159]HBS71171.1 hypothetical protein [Cyanobacteria bacterium UBA11153]HBW92343.1 hypothetical protein [Cyanobacteria bacterium UBA11149]HCA96371.1 hypothetical protein [Cyanobacteria bacterium UBA9226]